jgi:hypothetical protein
MMVARKRIGFWSFALCWLVFCLSAEAQVGRLFMTPESRALIDAQRISGATQTAVDGGKKAVAYIGVDVLLLSNHRLSVWVNQRLLEAPIELLGIRLDPKQVSQKGLMIISNQRQFLIKQGQAFIPSEQKVVEIYEAKRYR